MENSGDTFNFNNNGVDSTLQINRSSHLLRWFEVRVFYVRINNISADNDDSSPKCLTVNHIPLSPDTLLEVNGVRCGIMYSESVPTSQLVIIRRRSVLIADHHHKKKPEEDATFVSTDRIRFTGSIRFEVFNKDEDDDLILSGVLEMSKTKRWKMECEDHHAGGNGLFFKQHEAATMEVFVAGSFSGSPVILTKTVRILSKKCNIRKKLLDSIPEFETSYDTTTAHKQDLIHHQHHLQVVEYGSYNNNNNNKTEGEEEEEHNSSSIPYWGERLEEDYCYMEGGEDDGELSWFNAGVRVGVGIGLGICLGLGVGVGLLFRSYKATTLNFKRRFS